MPATFGDPPLIGAAFEMDGLERHRDWVLEHQRDVELQMFVDADLLEGDWSPRADRVRALLDGHTGRRGLHAPFWGLSVLALDPDVRRVVQRRLDQALDVAAVLGADQIVIHSPFTRWVDMNLAAEPALRDRLVDCVEATLRSALRRAEDQGAIFVMENIEDVEPAARRHLAVALNSPSLALSLDTGHAHWAHVASGGPAVAVFARDAGAALQHVHLQDGDGLADRHWAIGDGAIDWPQVLSSVARSAPHARLILELDDPSGIAPSVRHLAALGLGR